MATIILIAASLIASGADKSSGLGVPDLVKGLRAREGAIQTFSFRGDFTLTERSEFTGRMLKHAASCLVQVDRRSGRFRNEWVGQKYVAPGQTKGGQEHFLDAADVLAFDGRETRSFDTVTITGRDGKPREPAPDGRIASGPAPSWIVDPGDILHDSKLRRVSQILETWPSEILGPSESPGPGIVVVESIGRSDSGGDDPCDNRWRFWIDVAKNFVVVRDVSYVRRKGQSRWIAIYDSSSDDWLQIQDGIWVPRKYRDESTQMFAGKEPYLLAATEGTLKDWAINEPLDDDVFRVVFPKGTTVNDTIRGTVYEVGAIDDRAIAKTAQTAGELRSSYAETQTRLGEEERTSGRWPLVVAGLAVGSALVLAGIVFLRTRVASKGRAA